jgi:hypothetical protein
MSRYPPPPWSSPSWGANAQTPELEEELEPESEEGSAKLLALAAPEPEPTDLLSRLWRFWPEALVGFVAFMIYLQGLGTVSIWFDEAWSFGLANQPLGVMQHYLWGVEQNMTLYYILLHEWLGLLSIFNIQPTEFWLRLPSVIFVVLSVMIVYSGATRYFGRMTGLIAALLFLLNGWTLYAAQQARSYGLQLLLICLAWNALLNALSATERRDRLYMWICYSAAMTLAVYAHLFSLLIFAAQLLFIALVVVLPGPWRNYLRHSWKMAALSIVAVVALIAPILIDAKTHGGNNLFVPLADWSTLVHMFPILTQGTLNPWVWYLIAAFALLAIIVATVSRVWRPASARTSARIFGVLRRPSVGVLALVCWTLVPVILSYRATQPDFNLHLFYQRYLLVIVPALCLLAAVGIASLRWRAVQVVVALVVIALVANNLPHLLLNAQAQDFYTGMTWVQREYHPGDGLACAPAINCSVPMLYYIDAYPGPAHFDADSPGLWRFPLHSPTFSDLAALQRYAAKHQRIFFFTLHWSPGAPLDAKTLSMQQWLAANYELEGKAETSTGSAYLYVAKPVSSG